MGTSNLDALTLSGALSVTGAVTITGAWTVTGSLGVGTSATFNDDSGDYDFRVESNGLAYALYVDGAKDSIVIGDNTDVSDVDVRLRVGNVAKTLATGQSAAILHVAPTGATTEFTSGTHGYITTAYFKEPNITHAASGTITVASTVYIADAPTEGDTTNAALYVASGAVQLEGGAFLFNEAGADLDFRVESNGLAYALYVDGGNDCVVIGDNTDVSDVDIRLRVGNVAKTLATGQSATILHVAPTASTTEFTSGTHGYISSAYFAEPNITNAVCGTITTAATVYIADAPTEGDTNNAALFVAAGNTILAGSLYFYDTGGEYIASNGSTLTITGPTIAMVGAVTGDTTLTVTSTDATAAGVNAIYGYNDAGALWSSGNQVGVRGKVAITGSNNFVSATGVWAGLDFTTVTGSGSGLTCALNAEASSNNATTPNSVVYIQSLPGASSNFSNMPYLVFSETRGGATGTGSRYLFEVGHAAANTIPTIGTGELFYQNTLQIAVNQTAGNRTSWYIPLSSVEATFTTAFPIATTSTITSTCVSDGLSITAGTLANNGRVAKFSSTSATPAMDDGYGAVEIDATISGTATGWFSPLSSWINITGSGVAGAGGKMCAQSNGIYADAGANNGSELIFGMRMQAILTDTNFTYLCPFDLNTGTTTVTALFRVGMPGTECAYEANANEGSTKLGAIPLLVDNNGVKYYVRLYDAVN